MVTENVQGYKDKEFLANFRADVQSEVSRTAAKYMIGAAIGLVTLAAAGWWALLKPHIVAVAGGVPPGFVIAYDSPKACPEGWENYTDLAGKVTVGKGQGVNLTPRNYRDSEGKETHTLTVQEMPTHAHTVGAAIFREATKTMDGSGENRAYFEGVRTTAEVGGSAPHNNMPPFLVLGFCKKK